MRDVAHCGYGLFSTGIMFRVENGEIVRGRRTAPAYAPAFIDAVKSHTGDRYVTPKKK